MVNNTSASNKYQKKIDLQIDGAKNTYAENNFHTNRISIFIHLFVFIVIILLKIKQICNFIIFINLFVRKSLIYEFDHSFVGFHFYLLDNSYDNKCILLKALTIHRASKRSLEYFTVTF